MHMCEASWVKGSVCGRTRAGQLPAQRLDRIGRRTFPVLCFGVSRRASGWSVYMGGMVVSSCLMAIVSARWAGRTTLFFSRWTSTVMLGRRERCPPIHGCVRESLNLPPTLQEAVKSLRLPGILTLWTLCINIWGRGPRALDSQLNPLRLSYLLSYILLRKQIDLNIWENTSIFTALELSTSSSSRGRQLFLDLYVR